MEKANAKKFEMQVESIEEVKFEDVKKSFAGLANRDDIQLDPDLMYAKFIMCHEGVNSNGDTFTKEVLQKAQYTPRFKPIDWEHGQPFIGTILDSQYGETDEGLGYIEAIGAIWKFHYPDLAESIKSNSQTGALRLSMECFYRDANYKYGDQIFNQQQADDLGITDYVGREYMGQKVYRVFSDAIFGGVGVVANPADKNAIFLSVAKKKEEEAEAEVAIAEFNRQQNDFTQKQLSKDTVDAVTIAKLAKVFDKAKLSVIGKFNKEEIESKDLILANVKNTLSTLITDIQKISEDFYFGKANVDNINIDEMLNDILVEAKSKKEADDNNLDLEEEEELGVEKDKIEAGATIEEELEAVAENIEEVVDTEEASKKDPDNDGDDDTTPEGDTDHDKFPAKKKSKAEEAIAELQSKLDEKESAFASLEAKFNSLQEKVNASEKEALQNKRIAEIENLGIEFSEARKAKELDKIISMDNSAFEDYKSLLSEVAGKKSPVVASVVEDELVEEVVVENATASAGLNIEQATPKLIKPFGHLAG